MNQHNKSIVKAFEILEAIESERTLELTLSRLSEITQISVSTAFRMVSTLVTLGYLEKSAKAKTYRLGWKFLKLLTRSKDLREQALITLGEHHVIALSKKFDENASLYVRVQEKRLCLYRVEGSQDVRNVVAAGDLGDITKGSPGKVLLAFQPENTWESFFPLSDSAFVAMLRRIRAQGYAISDGDYTPGASSVSAPIFGFNGELLAALTLSGPSFRFKALRTPECIQIVMDTAALISAEFKTLENKPNSVVS